MTYKRVRPIEHLQRYSTAALWAVLLVLAAGAAVISYQIFVAPASQAATILSPPVSSALHSAAELALAAFVIGLGTWLLTRKLSRGWTWLFGWRRPAGRDGLLLAPMIILGAAAGGVWIPRSLSLESQPLLAAIGALVLAAVAVELCFRGLVHGLLILDSPVQTAGSRWFISMPVLASAGLYALASIAVARFWIAGPPLALETTHQMAMTGGAALWVGVALGMLRERALSLWPGVVAVILGGVARLAIEVSYNL